MKIATAFVAVISISLWLGVLVWLFVMAGERGMNHGWKYAVVPGVPALILLAAGLSILTAAYSGDQNASRLCLRGHEEWRGGYRSPVLVGKMIVPGGSYTTKTWVCEEWAEGQ